MNYKISKLNITIVILILVVVSFFIFLKPQTSPNQCPENMVYNEILSRCITQQDSLVEIRKGELFVDYCVENGGIVDGRNDSKDYGFCIYGDKKCSLLDLSNGKCYLFNK